MFWYGVLLIVAAFAVGCVFFVALYFAEERGKL
jgi:hypothetical protein